MADHAASVPGITVVLVVGSRREYAGQCLASLLGQQADAPSEILVVDVAEPGAAPVEHADHPAVRILRLPPGTLFAAARAAAVRAARAPVVAFLEEHTVVWPGWAAALARAHEGPWCAVGPRIANANPEHGKSRVIGLLNYGRYAEPLARGESRSVAGHNSSYKTAALLALGGDLEPLLGNDLLLQDRLQAAGGRFFLEPDAVVAHRNERGLRSIGRGIFLWYRCYGPSRAREHRWSMGRRALYVLAAPVIPFYFIAHYLPFLARSRKVGWQAVLRHLPLVIGMQLCGALGQAVGLLLGVGDAAAQFSRYELTEPRGSLHAAAPPSSVPAARSSSPGTATRDGSARPASSSRA